jgi:hypothetical protein
VAVVDDEQAVAEVEGFWHTNWMLETGFRREIVLGTWIARFIILGHTKYYENHENCIHHAAAAHV